MQIKVKVVEHHKTPVKQVVLLGTPQQFHVWQLWKLLHKIQCVHQTVSTSNEIFPWNPIPVY